MLEMVPWFMALCLAWSLTGDEKQSRQLFGLYTAVLAGLTAYVVSSFLQGNFALIWVAKYSSSSLNWPLRLAAIWAGQEGTLLLWLIALCVITWLYPSQRKLTYRALLGQQLLLAFGFLLLNPLDTANLSEGFGLNPLLQNPWMLVHPPIVFVGYALLAVPFCEQLVGEQREATQDYLQLAWLFLGVGLALGAVWAYGVLGWGGFWAWDPVEAASLAPLLLAIAAWHLRTTQAGNRLAMYAYLAVLWAAAITRSGVLAGSSVHAFAASPGAYYLFLVLGLHLVALIYSLAQQQGVEESRAESIPLVWQAVVLYSFWVVAGTALPLISAAFGSPIFVDAGFYRAGAIPAVLLTLWSLRHSLLRDGTARNLAHFGILLFLVGAVVSSQLALTETVALEHGIPAEVGDVHMTFARNDVGQELRIQTDTAQRNNELSLRDAPLVQPVIWRQPWKDIYVAPLSVGDRGGEEITLALDSSYNWQGRELRYLGTVEGLRAEGHAVIAELLYDNELIAPALLLDGENVKTRRAQLPEGGAAALLAVGPGATEVTLRLYQPEEAESLLLVEVSRKPLMNFVRFGAILAFAGSVLVLLQRPS